MGAPKNLTSSLGRLRIGSVAGTTIGGGRYRVFASLGRGGMADVVLAAVPGPKGVNKLVVVKRLRPLLAEDTNVANMFLDEARLAARLNHPNVIHTYEFGGKHGGYFIVMEYLDGQALHEVLHASRERHVPVHPWLWSHVIAEALAGLHYAHELRDYDGTPLGVVHRDVSPQNIVLTYEGGVKLVDFGIAKAKVNINETESEIIKGKLAYMAPEQADPRDGAELDRRADIFAMGIVLWECLTGKRLITGDARAAMTKIVDMEFEAPSKLNASVPAELDAIVLRALERAPADRYQTALEMREALLGYLRTQPLVGEKQVAELVVGLFKDQRESVQRQIRAQMATLETSDLSDTMSGGSDSSLASAIAEVRRSRPESNPDLVDTAGSEGSGTRGPLLVTDSVRSLRAVRTSGTRHYGTSWTTLLLAGGGLVASVAVTLFAMRGTAIGPVAKGSANLARSAAPVPGGTTHVSLRATPADAVITLDGARVANPFDGTFARDTTDHRLQIVRDGYVSSGRLVQFDRDAVAVDVKLDPVPPPPTAGSVVAPAKPAPAPAPAATPKRPPKLDEDPWK